jgi:hypothetical protein
MITKTRGWHQRKHKRTSSKGNRFVAGQRIGMVDAPKYDHNQMRSVRGSAILITKNVPPIEVFSSSKVKRREQQAAKILYDFAMAIKIKDKKEYAKEHRVGEHWHWDDPVADVIILEGEEAVNSYISPDAGGSAAIMFDGAGYDYFSPDADYNLSDHYLPKLQEKLKKAGFAGEHYHSWNLVAYDQRE